MKKERQVLEKMPKRDSATTTVPCTPPRRSPRILVKSEKIRGAVQVPPLTPQKSPRLIPQKSFSQVPKSSKSRSNRVSSLDLSDTISKKLSKLSNGLRNCGGSTCGSKRSATLINGFDGFSNLRRSTRISEKRNAVGYGSKDSGGKGGEFDYEDSSCENLSSRVIKSLKNDGVDRFQNRRSRRLSNRCEGITEHTEKTNRDNDCRLVSNSVTKEEALDPGKGNVRVNSDENLLDKGKRSTKREDKESDGECRVVKEHTKKTNGNGHRLLSNAVSKEEALDTGKGNVRVNSGRNLLDKGKSSTEEEAKESDGECRGVNAGRKRKRDEEGKGNVNGWNKDQELALQRAYLAAKPTPHFWKKVSKLVPGKSAQECFDKVNADHLTPPQRQRGAKKRRSLSPIPSLELSASKVLKPFDPNLKKQSYNNQKTRVTQKNVRQLLKKHYNQNQDHDADLFSVLEPNLDLSTQALQPNAIFSTPKNLQGKQGLLQKYNERSTSGKKVPLSRFSGSKMTALASPPVLKQVKNKLLHERYIDQLHNRDAKRKVAAAKKATLKIDDRKEDNVMKMDVVRSAKNALVFDAREAISMLQNIKTNARTNSSDSDDDILRSDDDDGESENGD
ncbi:uncharacterized protein LOC133806848 [Humulus lupulus]|uniref:uncharacterized protein LOC133806848 n=1 Tax=Humulus lupulus TaxID=3486 RepID=UPI002B41618F|nr:uncharacterized protein LOC133806848 [Humulus lupulus]